MPSRSVRHGCLFLASGAFLMAAARGDEPALLRSRVFEIEYTVNENAMPLDSVQLWYTLDRGVTWHEFGFDEDRQPPLTFRAPQEGLYGFYLVVMNSTGASSAAPTQATEPYLWAFVDYTPPVVQLHPLRQTTMLGQRVLQIRWTAIDAHFDARPIRIAYQRLPDEGWSPVTPDPLANTGRYDWRVPEDLRGPVAVRLTAGDKGGHRVNSERQVLEITQEQPQRRSVTASLAAPGAGVGLIGDSTALTGSPRAKERAARLFAEAVAHRERGEYREGIARLRETVRLNPQWAQAFAEMADMLYRIGDWDRALSAYELALRQEPMMRAALRGAAMVYRQKNDYASAAQRLRTILRYNPNDAEVWTNLGDIAVYQGDEMLARECYTRAMRIDPDATQTIAAARKRLALMAEVSRTYPKGGK